MWQDLLPRDLTIGEKKKQEGKPASAGTIKKTKPAHFQILRLQTESSTQESVTDLTVCEGQVLPGERGGGCQRKPRKLRLRGIEKTKEDTYAS